MDWYIPLHSAYCQLHNVLQPERHLWAKGDLKNLYIQLNNITHAKHVNVVGLGLGG